jgi:large subunit ribosomal protein L16
MLFPKKVKFRKWQTGRKNPNKKMVATRGTTLAFGSYGLQACDPKWVKSNQIESARRVLSHYIRKTGKIWIRVFPDKPFTKKPAEMGMGKGKGAPEGYVVPVKPGRIIFEVDGVEEAMAKDLLRKAGAKLPLKTKVISR